MDTKTLEKEMTEWIYRWSDEKNHLLTQQRGLSFERVVQAIENDKIIDIIPSPSPTHPDQECLVVDLDGYAHLVPFVQEGDVIFFKTIYPSRKHTRFYLRGDDHE